MFGDLTVWYLFLAGAGAGVLAFTAVLEQLTPSSERYAPAGLLFAVGRPFDLAGQLAAPAIPRAAFCPFFGPAYGAGLLAVLLGMLCLMADLGRPDRLLSLFSSPSLSYISVGTYILVALVICAVPLVLQWVFSLAPSRWLVAVARVGCMVIGVAVTVYTGLFLASLQAILFWYSPLLPLLFMLSAASTGLGLLMGAIALNPACSSFRTTLGRVRRIDAVLIVAEAFALALLLGMAYASNDAAHASAAALLIGPLAPAFWLFVVGIGLGVPFAAELFAGSMGRQGTLALALCLLIGGFFLRWCIVRAAAAPDIAAFVATAFGMG